MLPVKAEQWLEEAIAAFVRTDPRNTLAAHGGICIYDKPLVGIAAANDPYFEIFRSPGIVGPDFLLPRQWLPGAKSVVSYFLPFTKVIRDSNRKPGLPSQEWVSARIDGESFNDALRIHLVTLLGESGECAVAPALDGRFRVKEKISNWSERHVAFAAGLGTFGLHRALITAKGSAGRFGSVVTTLMLAPTPRPYTSYFEYCPFLSRGKCAACIGHCPPAAISRAGKDHPICSAYLDDVIKPMFAPRYGCAKCNIGVPCEDRIPNL